MGMAMFMTWMLMMTLPPLLIGCVAVAEERRLGTVLWHRTLPISAGKQWLIKLGVVYGLTFLIVWILPRCLPVDPHEVGPEGRTAMTWLTFCLATVGLSVSSLSKSLLSAFGTAFGLGIPVVCSLQFSENFMKRFFPRGEFNDIIFTGSVNGWGVGLLCLWGLLTGIGLAVGTLFLIFRNMQRVIPTKRDVLFTASVLLGVVVVSSSMSWMIFFAHGKKWCRFQNPNPLCGCRERFVRRLTAGFRGQSCCCRMAV